MRGAAKPGSGADKNANAKALAQNITDADSKGAIVTLSAHWYNPGTGKDFNDTTAVASELLPGGKYSGTFNKELDATAATAQQAKRSDGTLIPIIFRPLHENNGSWFWWGATHASASEYKELYRYIVDYLRDVKDVHNLLYAYSPGGVFNGDSTDYLATYPGDQWVDVLGYDEYDSDDSADDSSAWINTVVKDMKMVSDQASQRGKIVALTEFGRSGDRKFKESGTGDKDTKFFSELAEALAENVPSTAYMMIGPTSVEVETISRRIRRGRAPTAKPISRRSRTATRTSWPPRTTSTIRTPRQPPCKMAPRVSSLQWKAIV